MTQPDDRRLSTPPAIEAAWPDLLANLQAAYADLVKTRSDLERRAAELQDSRDLLHAVIAAMSEALFLVDRAGRIVQVNPAAGELLDGDEAGLIGRLFNQICPSPDVPITPWAILSRSPRGVVGDLTTTLRARLGQAVPVRLSCSVVRDRDGKINGVLIIAQDERPKHLLQQQLMQAERLAAYKRLASALAAELKAPLAALTAEIDHLGMARRPGPDDADGEPALRRLQEAAGRLSAIARHLREFGSPAHGAFTPLDLNEVVEKALLLVETQIGEAGIDLVRDLAPGLPPAQGDAHELEHVALSLIANACEAMQSEPHVRRLTLQTRAEQGQVILSVRDTGTGIPAELLPHVFDPLFTTKPPGSGLGLGLAYSREVVTRHGGTLEVRSQVGHGAAFTLALPALRNPGHHGGNA